MGICYILYVLAFRLDHMCDRTDAWPNLATADFTVQPRLTRFRAYIRVSLCGLRRERH